MESPQLTVALVGALLLRLQFKQEALWEQVLSILAKGAVEIVEMLHDRGWGWGWMQLLPGHQAHLWVLPHSQPQQTQHVSLCC